MTDLEAKLRAFAAEYDKHAVGAWLKLAAEEIARLGAAVRKANGQTEHFERQWYLRGDELEAAQKDAARYRWLRDESLMWLLSGPICIQADKWGNPLTNGATPSCSTPTQPIPVADRPCISLWMAPRSTPP